MWFDNSEYTFQQCTFTRAIGTDNIYNLIKKNEINCFLSGENDRLNIYLEIHAGAGGTESQDWAEMLRRMYLKWFDKKSFKYEIISEHKGDEAGIKSSILKVSGSYMYGWLKAESGVHRLVRLSTRFIYPYDLYHTHKKYILISRLNFIRSRKKRIYNSTYNRIKGS